MVAVPCIHSFVNAFCLNQTAVSSSQTEGDV